MISLNSRSISSPASESAIPTIAFMGEHEAIQLAYSNRQREKLSKIATLVDQEFNAENWKHCPELTRNVTLLFSTWGVPNMDKEFLEAFPNLKAVFYAAGTVKYFATEEVFDRGIVICAAAAANAIPVAEYTLSAILMSLKHFWEIARQTRQSRTWQPPIGSIRGSYHATVGLISLGAVGRSVVQKLGGFDTKIIAYDPLIPRAEAEKMGVKLVSLEDLFRLSDVISVHTPLIPETVNLITGRLLRLMKPRATFINTARGAIVNEEELCKVMSERPDLTAILDVTWPEPPCKESPLFELENVILTPHIAGSYGSEVTRMGDWMADEALRYLNNDYLCYQVTREMLACMA